MAGSNSNASNSGGATTAYIDVNQAINILASLAQQQVSSSAANGNAQSISVLPNSRLFGQNSVNLLGNIVSQGTKAGHPTSKGTKGLSMSATMDTLLGHLTSGLGSHTASTKNISKAVGGGGKVKKNASKLDGGAISKSLSNAGGGKGGGSKLSTSTLAGVPQSIQVMGSVDDLSNLNLLSSLVAAVAASQSTATSTSSLKSPSFPDSTQTSTPKTSVGQPSNIHSSSKTDVRRPLESVVSALSTIGRNSSSLSFTESSSNSSSYASSQSHTPTTSDEIVSAYNDVKKPDRDRGMDKLIAATSSIKKTPLQGSSSGGIIYGSSSLSSGDNELPRSVVRTGLGGMASNEAVGKQGTNSAFTTEKDMTASLASIIPSYNPSMSSQSSLLLYTRSLSFPCSLNVPSEPSAEEEDHLESATRGISELSKLLGTDNNPDGNSSSSHNSRQDHSVYKNLSNWSPADLLSNSSSGKNDFASGLSDKPGKPYLSSLLESQIHGTVHHHAPLAAPKLDSSSTNSARTENTMETALDVDHSR